jgi:hypothetical protein
MNNEKGPEQKPQPEGSANTPDTKTNPSPENHGQGNRPQYISNISNKNSYEGGDPKHPDQEKPEDEKRRAS